MKKRLLALLLAVMVVASCLTIGAAADVGNIGYNTEITTSKVSVGIDNYYCLIDPQTWEIYPFILIRQGDQLVSDPDYYAEDGDAVKVYPNKWARVNERGYFYYIETAKGNGYMWEMYLDIKHCEVTFDANGGKFDDGSTETSYNIPYEEPYTDLPVPYREGYTFEGWRMGKDSGEWALEGSPVISGASHTLYANWHPDTCTVHFDLNGMPGTVPARVEVSYGGTITLPNPENVPGYRFIGWYFDETKWENTTPVTNNIILTAHWEEIASTPDPTPNPEPDVDTFKFLNNNDYFGSVNHSLTGRYKEAIQSMTAPEDWPSVEQGMQSNWGGSCFGMAAVFCLNSTGDIDPWFFQNGAGNLYDLDYPKNNSDVKNLIEYYYLQQYTSYITYYTNLNAKLVATMKSENDCPVFICFFHSSRKDVGHAIVGLNGTENADGSYTINIWDPNYRNLTTLTLSGDNYEEMRFGDGRYPNASGVYGVFGLSDRENTYDHANLQDYLSGGSVNTNSSSNMIATSALSFKVTSASGQYAIIENGKKVEGNLEILPIIDFDNVSSVRRYALPNFESYTISSSQSDYYLLKVGNYSVEINSPENGSFTLNSTGEVVTRSEIPAAQRIRLTSGEIGGEWNSVEVKGEDTGFTLSAKNGVAHIASENEVAVQVVSSNIYTDDICRNEQVSSSDEGVVFDMTNENHESDGGDSEESYMPEEGENDNPIYLPFTDVAVNAWYYDAVSYAYTNGLMDGVSATAFNPDGNMTRAMVWAILARLDGETVTGSDWVSEARAWAMAEEVSDGTEPNAFVTREQLVTMLWRYAGEPAVSGGLSSWRDAESVSDWASDAMVWALDEGIITGVTAVTLDPQGTATRAQCAAILMCYAENV